MRIQPPETRYARSGELSIAYQSFGEGPRSILFIPGFVSNVELMWELPFYRHVFEQLVRIGRVTVFDKRGVGLSDRQLGTGSASDRMDDLRAVVDAAGIESATVIGLSEGGPLGILLASTYPERVRQLVLWGTYARVHIADDYPIGVEPAVTRAFIEHLEQQWGTGIAWRTFISHLPEDEDTRLVIASYERQSTTPGVMKQIMLSNVSLDVRDALPAVHAPTLVLQRKDDPLVPRAFAEYMAERIAGARLVVLPGNFHLSGELGRDDDALETIAEFVTGDSAEQVATFDRVLATVLFTDIVDSTAKAARLGDRAWTDLLERHDEAAEREIERHRGKIVKRTGDGLLATFDGPGRAVMAAHAIRRAARLLGIEVRAGIHTGEIERRDDDVSGIAVHIGARIGAAAVPGEVLVSNTVKDLVVGSGIAFADRGRHVLKGVPGEWQVWAASDLARVGRRASPSPLSAARTPSRTLRESVRGARRRATAAATSSR
jgi:class 3 adenylate cyclase